MPSILGVSSDFLQAEEAAQVELVRLEEAAKAPENKRKTQDIMKEAETSPESTEEQQRPSRQSFSFSSFGPFSDSSRGQQDEGLSFQRVRMGPGDTDRSVGFKVTSRKGLAIYVTQLFRDSILTRYFLHQTQEPQDLNNKKVTQDTSVTSQMFQLLSVRLHKMSPFTYLLSMIFCFYLIL